MYKKCYEHLESVHESYPRHLGFALWFGVRLIGAGLAAMLHGICPAVFQRTGSKTIFALHDELTARLHTHDHHHD